MKLSYAKGLSFGVASGIVTTLGLMVGLYSGTHSKLAVLGGILTIAIADAMSDAFGIHLAEESSKHTKKLEVWEAALATFLSKLIFALTFAIPVLLFDLKTAVFVSFAWGLFLLAIISIMIAKWREESILHAIVEHWGVATLVVILSYYTGVLISNTFESVTL
jgi:VIT1/CCC1 family predicted Fe2+/Mn2+ transporter